MQTVLFRIGKAWAVIQRDGLVRGGKRIWSAFFSLFQRVVPGDILFIAGGVGESARYRCHHVAEELRLQGFKTAVTVQDNPWLVSYADQFSVFVFHRTLVTPKITKLIERIKMLGKEIIFETDDLVFDPKFLVHMDYYREMNALERRPYEHGVGGEILADPYVTAATTTTVFLAEKIRERGKRVFLVPNKLSQKDVQWANAALLERKEKRSSVVRVGYLSGTPSHNKDFATISGPLFHLFETIPEWQLVLVGPIDPPPVLDPYMNRIVRVPFVSREKLFSLIVTLDINLAPLEIHNPFCESKSELKFFEAGVVGVPTVASATQTFVRAITDGQDGRVAQTEKEWIDKLGSLITNPSLRQKMGEAARATTLAKHTTAVAHNEEYSLYLLSRIKK